MATSSEKNKKISFEKAVEKLEKIVESMESGNLTLESSLKMYQRGVELLKLSHQQIAEVQHPLIRGDRQLGAPPCRQQQYAPTLPALHRAVVAASHRAFGDI